MQATQRQYFYAPPPTEAVLLVVPEEQLHLFKFYMDNTVCEAMRHSSGLYKLAYEIGTHQDFSQTLGCELSIQGSPIIISIGQNRYRVWVSLQAATTCIATPLQPTEAPRWVKSVPTSAPFEPRLSLSTPPMPLLPDAIAPFPGVVSEKLPDFQAHLPVSTVVSLLDRAIDSSISHAPDPSIAPSLPSERSDPIPLPLAQPLLEQSTPDLSLRRSLLRIFQPTNRIFSAGNAPDLLYWITDSLESGALYLLINFRKVIFMDRLGLESLVIGLRRVQKTEAQIALCCLSGQARMLVEMSHVELLFQIYDHPKDFEAAIAQSFADLTVIG